jgi:predicted TIM-barrel fold metal-dependent hydrolase
MIMYGSSYPHWHFGDHQDLPSAWTDEQRDKVLFGNAARLYGLESAQYGPGGATPLSTPRVPA